MSSFDQKGFSALPMFFMGLALIMIMGAAGFFTYPKSKVTDTTVYTSSGDKKLEGKGLHLQDLNFDTPTPAPTIPTTPVPTVPQPTYGIPTPTGNYCPHDGPRSECTCNPSLPIGLFCNGYQPPANATCTGDNNPICIKRASGDPTCIWYCLGKPVIYLYPTHPTYVDVALSHPEKLIESIPEYAAGWKQVLALPGGVLQYQNNYYRELYYELSSDKINPPDNGIIIPTENLREALKIQTEKLGLNDYESQEFTDYWTPRLLALNKPYIFFSVLSKEEKDRTDHVDISPKPDVFIEFIAYFKGVESAFQTKPFSFAEPQTRTGFTAVEWGGVIDR